MLGQKPSKKTIKRYGIGLVVALIALSALAVWWFSGSAYRNDPSSCILLHRTEVHVLSL